MPRRVPFAAPVPTACAVAFALALGLATTAPRAQEIDGRFPVTNGSVAALAITGDTLYVAGAFSWLGPANGSAVAFDAATGAPVEPWPRIPAALVDNTFPSSANVALADGEGGCFVGGNFTAVSGAPRQSLVHVRADGTVAPWDPGVPAWGAVRSLLLVGDVLYVGGSFATLGGLPRNGLAAVDARTGAVLPWNPALTGGSPSVAALATDGSRLFVGGLFTGAGGAARNGLAAFDLASGLVTAWDPNPNNTPAGLAAGGGVVWAWGPFSSIGGQARAYLAALDPLTGGATAWNAAIPGLATVDCVAIAGTSVYVGGTFTQIAGVPRNGLAALDAATAAALPWQPPYSWGRPQAMATDGASLYLGGSFHMSANDVSCALLAVDAATGLTTSWKGWAEQPVTSLSVGGSRVFASGYFAGCGTSGATNLAAIDLASGRPLDWRPALDGTATSLAPAGDALYVGGLFTSIGGQGRGGLAAFDRATGQLTAFDPSGGVHNRIAVLAADDRHVYAWSFSGASFGGHPASRLAAVERASGLPTSWAPAYASSSPYEYVSTLIAAGDRVYVTGEFSTFAGQDRHAIAAVDTATGAVLPWDAHIQGSSSPGSVGYVDAAVLGGASLYVGGHFSSIGGITRDGLAALDTATATATAWLPAYDASMRSLAASDSVVYVGLPGWELGLGDPGARDGLLALDAGTGALLPWYPHVFPSQAYGVGPLAAQGGDLIAAGFGDLVAGGEWRGTLVRVRPSDTTPPAVEVVSPAAGAALVIGSHPVIEWLASDDRGVESSDVFVSRAGPGGPWEPLAYAVTAPATSWVWDVPPGASEDAWVRVDARDEAGHTTSATSGPFAIRYTTGVDGPGGAGRAWLAPPGPNPVTASSRVAFSLPAPAHVRLVVADVQGREVAVVLDADVAAGHHVATLPTGPLAPGLYFVRLLAGGRTLDRRLVVLR